jgi:hypothetical protein
MAPTCHTSGLDQALLERARLLGELNQVEVGKAFWEGPPGCETGKWQGK